MRLQFREAQHHLGELRIRHNADRTVLKRDRIVLVNLSLDRIKTQQLGRKMQASHLGNLRTGDTLEGPALNRVQRLEPIPLTEKRSTTHDFALRSCQVIKLGKPLW
jgi:hypothetical protein